MNVRQRPLGVPWVQFVVVAVAQFTEYSWEMYPRVLFIPDLNLEWFVHSGHSSDDDLTV